jgi:hypothetical protein
MSVVDVADQGQSIGNFLVGHCDICQLVPGEDQNLFLFILGSTCASILTAAQSSKDLSSSRLNNMQPCFSHLIKVHCLSGQFTLHAKVRMDTLLLSKELQVIIIITIYTIVLEMLV